MSGDPFHGGGDRDGPDNGRVRVAPRSDRVFGDQAAHAVTHKRHVDRTELDADAPIRALRVRLDRRCAVVGQPPFGVVEGEQLVPVVAATRAFGVGGGAYGALERVHERQPLDPVEAAPVQKDHEYAPAAVATALLLRDRILRARHRARPRQLVGSGERGERRGHTRRRQQRNVLRERAHAAQRPDLSHVRANERRYGRNRDRAYEKSPHRFVSSFFSLRECAPACDFGI